jgi:hypothetical protein
MTPKGSRPVRKAGWWAAMPTWLPDYLGNSQFFRIHDNIDTNIFIAVSPPCDSNRTDP